MDISSRLDFEADPKTVYQMMTDKGWLEELVSRVDAASHTIDVAGPTTRVSMAVNAPEEVRAFIGATMDMVQTVQWSDAAADDSRTGTLVIEVPGKPVTMNGDARLYPGGRGTVVEYAGELKVNVPFVGKKIEQQAAPYVKQAIDAQQQAGDDWLAARS
ncbi:DUF2505 domain-containing protein [Luteococcus peritonei]|uniref:DUF2505 domain-containing protein n=1 Tax=Luteococcus peritonei TaxID=88874 RepID=A0ABW4RRH9_9ACTN